MSRSEHDPRWEDDRAAYLLGALDDAEAAAFADHLSGCDRCRAELRWLAPAVSSIVPISSKFSAIPPA